MRNTQPQPSLELPNFDELIALAKHDPAEFDALKQQLCEQVIQSASQEMQPRLRAQQSHIDRMVARCKNPIHTNIVLMNELQRQVAKFQDVLNHPTAYLQKQQESAGNVVDFPTQEKEGEQSKIKGEETRNKR